MDKLETSQKPGSGIGWKALRRVGLSAFVVYHLAAVMIAPNGDSYFGKRLQPVIEPYVSFFEFTDSWSFFAPDPGPPPVFVEWELLDKDDKLLTAGSMPESLATKGLRERQNRTIAAVEFMLMSDDRIQKMLVPYLCKSNPGTHSVKLWKKAIPIPSMEEVEAGKRRVDDGEQVDRRWVSRSFCEEAGA